MRVAVAVAALALAGAAHAEPPRTPELAALVPAPDARNVLAIGPHGEVYEPDGKGAWLRRHASSIAGEVASGMRGAAAIVATKDGAAFRLANGAWSVVGWPSHGKALVGAGPRPIAAVGRVLFALDRAAPARLAEAPAPPDALAASPTGVVIQTDAGLARLDGAAWKPIKGAPPRVLALLSDRFALVASGVLELAGGKLVAWPTGAHVEVAIATPDGVVAVLLTGSALQLATLRTGKLTLEPVPLDPVAPPRVTDRSTPGPVPASIVALATDRDGRVVVAARDGRLCMRDRATWSTITVRDELPAAKPGPPPALSK